MRKCLQVSKGINARHNLSSCAECSDIILDILLLIAVTILTPEFLIKEENLIKFNEIIVAQSNAPWAIPPFRKNEILIPIKK